MIVRVYFRTGESVMFARIDHVSEVDMGGILLPQKIILIRGADIEAKFFMANIAGYSKREDE